VIAMYFFFLPFLPPSRPTSWYYFEIHGWRPWDLVPDLV